jgi:hypothetical protein
MNGALYKADKTTYNDFIVDMLTDTFVHDHIPDKLELIDGLYFKLTFFNKSLLIDTYAVDISSDYVDVYIYTVKQPSDRYVVTQVGNDLVIMFTADITKEPTEVVTINFIVRAKWQT